MKEEEIRPQELFNRYLEIARRDIDRYFKDKSMFVRVACPGCSWDKPEMAFDKLGFEYQRCTECGSLYLSPRPSQEMINRYYEEGDAVKFWSTNFYKETVEARRQKIFRPRARLVADLVRSHASEVKGAFVDVGAGYGIFLEEVSALGIFELVKGIEPAPNMAEACRTKGFDVIERPVEAILEGEINGGMVTNFEVLEHVFSPESFLMATRRILRDDGILFFTTLTISGFDLQVLWDRSKSIYPPHHINLLSFEGLRSLVERCGFEILDLSTPGKLDLDIVRNALREDQTLEIPPFVRYLIERRAEKTHEAFQLFLQANNLSSHIRCVARRTNRARTLESNV